MRAGCLAGNGRASKARKIKPLTRLNLINLSSFSSSSFRESKNSKGFFTFQGTCALERIIFVSSIVHRYYDQVGRQRRKTGEWLIFVGARGTRGARYSNFSISERIHVARKSHDVCTRVNRNCGSLTRWPHSHHLKKWIQRSNDRLNRFEFAIGNLIETRSAIGYWKSYENVSRFQRCDAKIPLFAFRAVSV